MKDNIISKVGVLTKGIENTLTLGARGLLLTLMANPNIENISQIEDLITMAEADMLEIYLADLVSTGLIKLEPICEPERHLKLVK